MLRKLVYIVIILLMFLTPLYKQSTSDFVVFEDYYEKLEDGLSKSLFEGMKSTADYVKSKLYEGEDIENISDFEKQINTIFYGFGYGYNALGAVRKSYKFSKYKKYEHATLTAAFLTLSLTFMLITFTFKELAQIQSFAGLLTTLNIILFLGFSSENTSISVNYFFSTILLLFSFWVMLKKNTTKNASNQHKADDM